MTEQFIFTQEEIEDMRLKMGWTDDAPDFCMTNALHREEAKKRKDDIENMILKTEGELFLSEPVYAARFLSVIQTRLSLLESRVLELESTNKKLRDALS